MKKLFSIVSILLCLNASAQVGKHIELNVTDTVNTEIDYTVWKINPFMQYAMNVDIDSAKWKASKKEFYQYKQSIIQDSSISLYNSFLLSVNDLKDVEIYDHYTLDNVAANFNSGKFIYLKATSLDGLRNIIRSGIKFNNCITFSLIDIVSKNVESKQNILRQKIVASSYAAAKGLLKNYNANSAELFSISQIDNLNFYRDVLFMGNPPLNSALQNLNVESMKIFLDDKQSKYMGSIKMSFKVNYLMK